MMNNEYPGLYSLKWHKFLIYFSLWAGCVLNIVSAINYISGAVYGINADYVYNRFPSLKTVDTIVGVCLIGVGIFALITRFSLAGFKQKAPSYLLTYYLLNIIIQFGYVLMASSVTRLSLTQLAGTQFWTNIAVSVAFMIANKVYYDKRISLFRN